MTLETERLITIRAPIERVWEVLTSSDLRRRWFFGVDTDTDWSPGSPIVHRGEYQGRPYEDKGLILEIEPPRLLVHSHWSPVSGLPDDPRYYQRVSWQLSERDDGTELTLTEVNLPSEEAKTTSEQAWDTALDSLRRVAEE